MIKKTIVVLLLAFIFFFLFIPPVSAIMVQDDEGNAYNWEPPNEIVVHKDTIETNKRTGLTILNQTNVELLFLMDTSGSMDDEFSVLCSKMGDIILGLQNNGIHVESKILGITNTRDCATDTVSTIVSSPTVDDYEDWGPAVADIANQYRWKSGYVRIVMPMSDEGAENGDNWDSADTAVISRAKKAAKDNQVAVFPVVCSGYSQSILNGAKELANYCWGKVFVSTTPTDDLVKGVVDSIKGINNPVSDQVKVQLYIDDAYAQTGADRYVNKIAGDIAFLVAEVTNGSDSDHTGSLSINFPSSWDLVDHNPVVKRKNMAADEIPVEQGNYIFSKGKLTIDTISFNKKAKTDQYVVKVIIPENENTSIRSIVTAEISGNSFTTEEDMFTVNMIRTGDIILTNRNLLYKRHADTNNVNNILKELYKISHSRNASVFFVDWWDEYDNFAKDGNGCSLNPNGTGINDETDTSIKKEYYDNPIKWWGWDPGNQKWDRDVDIDYTSEATASRISTFIDKYTHYWAGRLGGLNQDRYLLIVGGDSIIPFYRLEGLPTNYFNDPPGLMPSSHYNASTYTEHAADHSLAYSDVIYADTDGKGYKNGTVENIYPGRIVGEDSAELLSALKLVTTDRTSVKNCIISAYNFKNNTEQLRFPQAAELAVKDAQKIGYKVNLKNGEKLYNSDTFQFTDLKKEFANGFDHFIWRGHGSKTQACYRFDGKDFDGTLTILGFSLNISALFGANPSHFMMISCLNGLLDRDRESSAKSLMIYSLLRNNVRDVIGATTVSNGSRNNDLLKSYFRSVIGYGNAMPETLGKSLKAARVAAKGNAEPNYTRACAPIYVLYGTPWHKYPAPEDESPKSQSIMALQKVEEKKNVRVMSVQNITKKTISETIADYFIEAEGEFEFITMEGYSRFERDGETPVLPHKRYYITLPSGSSVKNISLTKSDPIKVGTVNIPVPNPAPPSIDPDWADYLEAPGRIGLFDSLFDYYTYTTQDNLIVVLDLFPVAYDTRTGQATLYSDLEIEIEYDTANKGVLISAGPEKTSYSSGEAVNVLLEVENIVDTTAFFDVTVAIKDNLGQVLQNSTATIKCDPATVVQETVQLRAPSLSGGYWVETSVDDSTSTIGTSRELINVNTGNITKIDIPDCKIGSRNEFSVTYENISDKNIQASFALTIYQGSTLKADFLPRVFSISPSDSQAGSFVWEIPKDFEGGKYLAVATVTVGGKSLSMSKDFIIGTAETELTKGWNLISLPLQPGDARVEKVLTSIAGKYYSVWAFENGGWLSYDPANPNFSDLSSMNAGSGYWINMSAAATLEVAGTNPSETIDLVTGWNLVGCLSAKAKPVADMMASIEGKYSSVWGLKNNAWNIYSAGAVNNSLVNLEPWHGYWLNLTEDCTWLPAPTFYRNNQSVNEAVPFGFNASAGETRYFRIQLSDGATFTQNPTYTCKGGEGSPWLSPGGGAGENFILFIYQVPVGGVTQYENGLVTVPANGISSIGNPDITMTVTQYSRPSDALSQNNSVAAKVITLPALIEQ